MLFPHRPRPHLRGFTVLEIAAALALIAVISLVAFPKWRAAERSAADRAARLTLASLEPEVARVTISAGGEVPVDVAFRMRVGGLTLTAGTVASRDANSVSVAPLAGSADRAVLALLSDSGACWVMSTTIDAEPRWGVDRDPDDGACRASEPGITDGSVAGTEGSPSELNLSIT